MDSTDFNKIAGGVIGAFLLFLLLHFAAGKIYDTRPTHAHDEPLAFALEVESDEPDPKGGKNEPAVDYAALVAKADLANGEKLFRKCKSCHKLEDGANGVGPTLWGVVGRDIASAAGFGYSGALTGLEGDWTLTAMSGFLKNPKEYAKGNKMAFGGIKDAQDRVDLIAYLNQADGTPIELAAAPAATDGAAGDGAAKPEDAPAATDDAKSDDAPAATDDDTKSEGDAAKPEDDAAKAEDAPKTDVAATDTKAEDTAAAPAGETAAAFAGGDANEGKKVFRKCRACHKVEEGKHGVGPSLWGVINSDIAAVEGFTYSKVLTELPGNWTATELSKFLANPKAYAKGTKMAFGGLKKEKDIVNLLTYLNEADGTPDPLQ